MRSLHLRVETIVVLFLVVGPLPGAVAMQTGTATNVRGPAAESILPVGALDSLEACFSSGRYAEVVATGLDLLSQLDGNTGVRASDAARILNLLVEARLRSGDYGPDTISRAAHALDLLDAADSPALEVARALENRAEIAHAEGEVLQARTLLERAFALRSQAAPTDHGGKCRTLRRLGALELSVGDHAAARRCLDRAATLCEIAAVPDPYEHIMALGQRRAVALEQGHLTVAMELLDRTGPMTKAHFGTAHALYAVALGWAARTQQARGAPEVAVSLYASALRTCEASVGFDNTLAATLQRDAALLEQERGNYAEARRLLEAALDTFSRRTGPGGLDATRTTGDLGVLLWELGDPVAAAPLLEKRLAHKSLGGYVRERVRVACALASAQGEIGAREASRTLFAKTVALAESSNTLAAETRAFVYSEYATRYFLPVHDHRQALAFLEKALTTLEPTPQTMEIATAMARLAEVLCLVGDQERALPLAEKSLVMRRGTFGGDHPATASSLELLARIRLLRGDAAQAFTLALQAEAAARRHFQSLVAELSEREALRYQTLRDSGIDAAVSALQETSRGSMTTLRQGDEVRKLWDQILRSRHLVLDEMAARVAVGYEDDAELQRLRAESRAASQRLADLVVQKSGTEDGKEALQQAREALDEAERRYAARNKSLRQVDAAPGLAEIETILPAGTALVSYVRYKRITRLTASQGSAGMLTETPRYGAFVLASGTHSWMDLGEAAAIDSAVEAWRRSATRAPRGSHHSRRRDEAACQQIGVSLRRRIWDPLLPSLAGAHQVLIVPDAALHVVNVAALPVDSGRYLLEEGPVLHMLSSEKDLLPRASGASRREGLIVLGGPDYDQPAAPDAALFQLAGLLPESSAAPSRNSRTRQAECVDFASLRFAPLPASGSEAEKIAALWQAQGANGRGGAALKLLGPVANEYAFKLLAGSRRVVHLATHGFFLGGCIADADRAREAVRYGQGIRAIAVENPLLLCGLALAGANLRSEAEHSTVTHEDGILTAEEVAALDLSGVEWAVLSACESGLGTLRDREGVLGLRRAFEVAGVRTLVLSLWAVEDQATLEWMQRLYENRLAGASSAEAVRGASLQTLEARRRAGRSTHPFYWGAFVATGDWR